MHLTVLSLATLIMAVALGCSNMSPSPAATAQPEAATNTPAPTSPAVSQPLPTVMPEEFFLLVSSPENESVVEHSPVEVQGSTVVDGVVTVNGQVVDVGPQGEFSTLVDLEEGPNIVEVIASDFAGHEDAVVLSVIYIP